MAARPSRPAPTMTRERLRLAVPNKGRLVEPTVALLRDAGLVFEEQDRSARRAASRTSPLDILFVRTERRRRVRRRRRGRPGRHRPRPPGRVRRRPAACCASSATAAAGSRSPFPPTRPATAIEDLAGLRVATSHPNLTRRFFADRGHPGRGRPAVAARPRSRRGSASRTRSSTSCPPARRSSMNGLRPIGDIFASEAILLGATAERGAGAHRRELDVDRDDARRGHRRARPQVPDDERAGREARSRRSRRCCPGLESPSRDPARPRRDDRHPLGRGGRRGVGPARRASRRRARRASWSCRSRSSCRDGARCARPTGRRSGDQRQALLDRRAAAPRGCPRRRATRSWRPSGPAVTRALREANARFGGGLPGPGSLRTAAPRAARAGAARATPAARPPRGARTR